jgi:sugar lactone lactonase YvrE
MRIFLSSFILIFLIIINSNAQKNQPIIETFIPNFPANGFMNVDKDGNLYVSEYGVFTKTGGSGKRLYKISPKGKLLDSITNLSGPIGTVLDNKENLYINNDNNTKRSIILKVDKKGNQTKFAEVKGWPIGIKKNKKGVMYLTNYNSPEIFTIDKKGKVDVFVKNKELIGTAGIDFDAKGNLIVANFATAKIFSITPKGEIKKITELKDIVVQGWGIGHLTVLDDTIYATGIAVSKVFKISLDGKVELFAGNGKPQTKDGLLKEASFNYPNGITSDKKNKIIYISEYGSKGGIRKIQL